jgi:riboflavin kinase/FMN adenylyltransferase
MQVHFGEELLHAEWHSAVGCLGTFDGVHLGHQEVIRRAVELARNRGLPCVLITFDRHPAAILKPERCPKAIASLRANLEQIARLGVSCALVLPFTHELSQTSAIDFFEKVLVDEVKSTALVVGHDFAFGKGREGTTDWLSNRTETIVVPPFEIGGKRVSSSRIRAAIASGDVAAAAGWLGRPFSLEGAVVGGQKLGRQLGFPTANLARSYDGILPQDGIYGGVAHLMFGSYRAAISIGFRPTVGGSHRTVEAYFLDYPGKECYGHSVVLEFASRIRAEEKFESLDDLKVQMAQDVKLVANEIPIP